MKSISGPEGIRTLDHLIKSQMLYLAELQALDDSLKLVLWTELILIYKSSPCKLSVPCRNPGFSEMNP
jgi:hypothetical protein